MHLIFVYVSIRRLVMSTLVNGLDSAHTCLTIAVENRAVPSERPNWPNSGDTGNGMMIPCFQNARCQAGDLDANPAARKVVQVEKTRVENFGPLLGRSRERQIAMGTAELQPRAPDRSGHCRTSAASARSQWALLDLSCK
eukprot:s2092_g2.t1